MRAASTLLVRQQIDLTVDGLENVPSTGPVIIAARHFHHLFDGCVLLATVPRPLSILVALDWVKQPVGKRVMTALCHAAEWPIVERRSRSESGGNRVVARGLREATKESLQALSSGRVLVVFPEGYPNIDPGFTPKPDQASFLPFEPGVVRLAAIAVSRGLSVPIVPAGFAYQPGDRWKVRLAFGEPVRVNGRADEAAALRHIEADVRRLSAPADQSAMAEAP
jgi:putative membrane protein